MAFIPPASNGLKKTTPLTAIPIGPFRHPGDRVAPAAAPAAAGSEVLHPDPVRIAAVGEDRRRVIGIALAVDHSARPLWRTRRLWMPSLFESPM